MSLETDDLTKIENLIVKHLSPIREDGASIKADVKLLASLNQLDEIRKDARLRTVGVLHQQTCALNNRFALGNSILYSCRRFF